MRGEYERVVEFAFAAIMRRAEARHRDAVVTFLTAQGDRVLGLGKPA